MASYFRIMLEGYGRGEPVYPRSCVVHDAGILMQPRTSSSRPKGRRAEFKGLFFAPDVTRDFRAAAFTRRQRFIVSEAATSSMHRLD